MLGLEPGLLKLFLLLLFATCHPNHTFETQGLQLVQGEKINPAKIGASKVYKLGGKNAFLVLLVNFRRFNFCYSGFIFSRLRVVWYPKMDQKVCSTFWSLVL